MYVRDVQLKPHEYPDWDTDMNTTDKNTCQFSKRESGQNVGRNVLQLKKFTYPMRKMFIVAHHEKVTTVITLGSDYPITEIQSEIKHVLFKHVQALCVTLLIGKLEA